MKERLTLEDIKNQVSNDGLDPDEIILKGDFAGMTLSQMRWGLHLMTVSMESSTEEIVDVTIQGAQDSLRYTVAEA